MEVRSENVFIWTGWLDEDFREFCCCASSWYRILPPQAHQYSNDDLDATINRRASNPCDFRLQCAVQSEVLFEFSRRDIERIKESNSSFDKNLWIMYGYPS